MITNHSPETEVTTQSFFSNLILDTSDVHHISNILLLQRQAGPVSSISGLASGYLMAFIVFRAILLFITPVGVRGYPKDDYSRSAEAGISARTAPLLNHLSYIDSLPFGGITINIPATCAFGIFDQQWLPAYPMNQSTFQSAIMNGLNYTDEIVWTYAEKNDYLTPGGVNQSWINAIWNARTAAGIPAPGANKGTSGTIGNAPSVSNIQVTNVTQTTATISWKVVSGLETLNHDRILADCKVLSAYMGPRNIYLIQSTRRNSGRRVSCCLKLDWEPGNTVMV